MCSSWNRFLSIFTVLLVAHSQAKERIKRQTKSETIAYKLSAIHPSQTEEDVIAFKEKLNTNRRKARSLEYRHRRWRKNTVPDDPDWNNQVYLKKGTSSSIGHNVIAVWEKGFTGMGITVAVIDDGLQITHKEIENSYLPHVSYDFITNSRHLNQSTEGHGTKCAGVIVGSKNRWCGIGVAFDAKVAGIRLFESKPAPDEHEAKAFSPEWTNKIDIFSNSWGPRDTGMGLRGPKKLAQEALRKGVTEGRDGYGSIYVFAAGNGGLFGDSCAFNGYVNSIYTIAVGAVNKNGKIPYYSSPCAAIMTSAYAQDLVTASSLSDTACETKFGHTSAATALTSGIIALALQANEKLTWRDMQHLIARSCDEDVIRDDDHRWIVNAAGFKVSERVGFGVLNALTLVKNAQNWIHASPEQIRCELAISQQRKFRIKSHVIAIIVLDVNDQVCSGGVINYLEHVQLKVDLEYGRRGLIAADITSPGNTMSRMLHPRKLDYVAQHRHFTNWTTTSVQFWGEPSAGRWRITFKNGFPEYGNSKGTLFHMSLILHGTKTKPGKAHNDRNGTDDDNDGELDDDSGGGKKDNPGEPTTSAKNPTTKTNIHQYTSRSSKDTIIKATTLSITFVILVLIILFCCKKYQTKRQARQDSAKRDDETSQADTPQVVHPTKTFNIVYCPEL